MISFEEMMLLFFMIIISTVGMGAFDRFLYKIFRRGE